MTFVTADKEKNKRILKLTEENFSRLFFLLKAIFYIYRFANLSKNQNFVLAGKLFYVFCFLYRRCSWDFVIRVFNF